MVWAGIDRLLKRCECASIIRTPRPVRPHEASPKCAASDFSRIALKSVAVMVPSSINMIKEVRRRAGAKMRLCNELARLQSLRTRHGEGLAHFPVAAAQVDLGSGKS